jgi:hypothetical protein
MAIDTTAEQTINGAFGTLSIINLVNPQGQQGTDATFKSQVLANVQSVEARVNVDRRDLKLAGSRQTEYKAIGASGEGSFTIFRVTSEFMNLGVNALGARNTFATLGGGNNSANPMSLTVKLNDPESPGSGGEVVTLNKVKIWEIPFGFSVDDLVQQTITFTFQTMALTKEIG